MPGQTKRSPPNLPRRRGRPAFLAIREEVREALARGEPLRAIYEERADGLPFKYAQFCKYAAKYLSESRPTPLQAEPGASPAPTAPSLESAPQARTEDGPRRVTREGFKPFDPSTLDKKQLF